MKKSLRTTVIHLALFSMLLSLFGTGVTAKEAGSGDGTAPQAGVTETVYGPTVTVPVPTIATDPDLIAHYAFDDASSLGLDSSGNGNNGTVGGGITQVEGKVGTGSALFDGADSSIITVSDSDSLKAYSSQDQLTISLWVKPEDNTAAEVVGLLARGNIGLRLFDDSGAVDLWYGSNQFWPHAHEKLVKSTWQHYTATYSGGTVKYYFDGVNTVTHTTDKPVIGTDGNLEIGRFAYQWTKSFKGQMDDIRVYKRALTDAEVQALAQGTSPEPDTEAPSVPANLRVVDKTSTSIRLSWDGSMDNVGVTEYEVYVGGILKQATAETSVNVTGLAPKTAYAFTVKAKDAAGNLSQAAGPVEETTNEDNIPGPEAVLYVKESFDGNTGTLHQMNGGTGWSSPWEVQNNNTDVPGFTVGSEKPLTYAGLYRTDQYAQGGSQYLTAFRALDTSGEGPLKDYVENGRVGKAGKVLWISAMVRKEKDDNNPIFFGTDWPSAKFQAGFFYESVQDGVRYWSLKVGETVYRTNVPIVTGETALLALKVEFGATNTVSLYVNPAELGGAPPAAPTVQATTDTDLSFRKFDYTGGNSSGSMSIDEIRIGNQFKAVTPTFLENQPPSAPTQLAAAAKSDTSVTLSWGASVDNVGVTEYKIYQGSNQVGTTAQTTYMVKGLTAGTNYTFTVKAVDSEGNVSPASEPLEVMTEAEAADPARFNFENGDLQGFSALGDTAKATVTADNTKAFAGTGSAKVSFPGTGVSQVGWNNPDSGITKGKTIYIRFFIPSGQDEFSIQPMVFGNGWVYNGGWVNTQDLEKDKWHTTEVKFENGDPPCPLLAVNLHASKPGIIYFDSITYSGYGEPDTEPPSIPANLRLLSNTDNMANLSWNASADNESKALTYEVYANGQLVETMENKTSAYVLGLNPETQYEFTVKAKDAAGNVSAASNAVSLTTEPAYVRLSGTPFGSPSANNDLDFNKAFDGDAGTFFESNTGNGGFAGLDLGENGGAKLTKVKFMPRPGFTGRMNGGKVQGANSLEGPYTTLLTIRDMPKEGWNELKVTDPRAFRYVRYVSPEGGYANVAELEFYGVRGDTEAPSVPTGLQSAQVTETSLVLSWQPSTDNEGVSSYIIYEGTHEIGKTPETTYDISDLEPDRTYSFTVRAVDGAENVSAPSAALQVATLPATVEITSIETADLLVKISGSISSGSDQQLSLEILDPAQKRVHVEQLVSGNDGTFLIVLKLEKQLQGQYKAIIGGTGVSIPAEKAFQFSGNPADTDPPTVPSQLTAPVKTHNIITLNWAASQDNVGVVRYLVLKDGQEAGTTAGTEFTLTGLAPKTKYTLTVIAEDGSGNRSSASLPLEVTTAAAPLPGVQLSLQPEADIVKPGDTIDIVVAGSSLQQALGYDVTLQYDTNAFEFVGAVIHSDFKGNANVFFDKKLKEGGKVQIIATRMETEVGVSGDAGLAVLTLKAKNVHQGAIFTLLKGSKVTDKDDALFELSANATASVFIANADVNGRDGVQINDLVIVAKAFGKPEKYNARYDMNGDGTINILDLAYIANQLLENTF